MLNRKAIDGGDVRGVEDIKEGLGVRVPAVRGRVELEVGGQVEEKEVVGDEAALRRLFEGPHHRCIRDEPVPSSFSYSACHQPHRGRNERIKG